MQQKTVDLETFDLVDRQSGGLADLVKVDVGVGVGLGHGGSGGFQGVSGDIQVIHLAPGDRTHWTHLADTGGTQGQQQREEKYPQKNISQKN